MKKTILTLSIILIIILIGSFISYRKYKDNEEKKAQERYNEIRESVKKAVEWNISNQHPYCQISHIFKEGNVGGSFYNSSFLLNYGYIKKSELLDVDNESYCDVYVKIETYYEDKSDYAKGCEVSYKIFLKCKNYEDEGYINWG